MSYISQDIETVVKKVNSLIVKRGLKLPQVRYMAGHFVEVNNRINALSNSPQRLETFPLIALRLDASPTVSDGLTKYDLNIVIMQTTKIEWNAEQRFTELFPKYLTPIFNLFMEAIYLVRLFCWEGDEISHVPIDRPYFKGASGANAFSEYVDAIEIQNLKVSKLTKHCS